MILNVLLVISAIYMALPGLGFVFVPKGIGIGAVPADATGALIAYLRVFGSIFLAIAVLNWIARNAEPSTARHAIVLANTVGFGLAALLDILGALSGGRRWHYYSPSFNFFLPLPSSGQDARPCQPKELS